MTSRPFTPEEDNELLVAYRAAVKQRTWLVALARDLDRTPRALERRLHQLLHGKD